ncbi:MAG: hypothetical protein RIQ94_3471 [Pseudomonadota bacterium]
MNNNTTLIPDQILVGEELYAEAINIILSSAEHELVIFDQDLSHGNFASNQKLNLFQQFLNKSPGSHLTIILQDTTYFQSKCPKLLNLLTIYSHKMIVYQTNQSDKQHYIKRIHIDQARFKYGLNDIATANLLTSRFEELLNATQHVVATAGLGL